MTQMLDDLRRAADAPAPKDFRPGVIYGARGAHDLLDAQIQTEAIPQAATEAEWEEAVKAMGIFLPEGYTLLLTHAELAGSSNPASWMRDAGDRGGKDTAYTAPNTIQRWRYRFKVVLRSARSDADIALLAKDARRYKHPRFLRAVGGEMLINLADFQVGKTDVRGGTAAVLERSEIALTAVLDQIRRDRPVAVILADLGDSTEGYESSPNAARTNDLQQTEQIRVWRRILWRWIEAISRLVARLRVVGVPSNHCRVRQGKNYVGTTLDDWGIEVIAQVSDIAAGNPDAFGHVEFLVPGEHDEFLILELANGKSVAFAHGHQVGKPDALPDYCKKNGRRGVGQADYVFFGHFHHLRVVAFGDGQYLFICPTNDNGSGWFAASGEFSQPGVLVVTFHDSGAWTSEVHWTGQAA